MCSLWIQECVRLPEAHTGTEVLASDPYLSQEAASNLKDSYETGKGRAHSVDWRG